MILNNTNIIIQIIANIFLIVGGIITIREYFSSVKRKIEIQKKEQYHRDRQKIAESIELARYYKDHILPSLRKLKNIYIQIGIYGIMESIDKKQMINFDSKELNQLLTKEQIKQIEELGKELTVATVIQDNSIACNTDKDQDKIVTPILHGAEDNKNIDYTNLMFDVLNSMEYFSMHFTHNTADHTVVYQSLHMTFIDAIRMLYWHIASINTAGEQKFFVNTIELYKIWIKQSTEQEEKEIAATRDAVNIGNILEDCKK